MLKAHEISERVKGGRWFPDVGCSKAELGHEDDVWRHLCWGMTESSTG